MIHPTAVLDETGGVILLGERVHVGPCAVLVGPLVIGDDCRIHACAVVGDTGESYGREVGGGPVSIGAGTVIREHVAVQRHTRDETPTTIGAGCYVMHGAHVAHDCRVGDGVTLSPYVVLGGHSAVHGCATLGIGASVHQRRVIGSYAMIGMGAVVVNDVEPGAKMVGVPARRIGTNTVGLDRWSVSSEMLAEEIERWNAARLETLP